jgi:hypothetical protein
VRKKEGEEIRGGREREGRERERGERERGDRERGYNFILLLYVLLRGLILS